MENEGKMLRVKKKAKPSSSCRSAEFLGNQKALFPTQIQKALGPFKIGLSDDDTSIEYLANSNLCVLIRKLNKKDPITKKKALEELIDDINHADVEELIKILPLWSKIYKNLAFDPTHNVRDLTQVVHKMLALKCKRNMAPYLKLLVPVWLFSHFDNYTPAASTARSSFYDIFDVKLNRIKEVCLHCQLQILEHIHEHLSKSLVVSTSKDIDDNHFNGNIYSSLEVFSFFTEHTKTANLLQQSHVILRSILELNIFWSFGTQGSKPVRTAWFKVINNLVSNESINGIILDYKWKIIEISFNGIDEKEEMLSSAIWKLILQLQLKYSDWYNHLDYEIIQLKLLCLFQNNLFYNFQVVCPKMLSFYSALMTAYFSERDWHTLLGKYLTDLKLMFCSESLNAKEKDYGAIFDAYFDCWKYILSKFHSANHTDTTCSLELLHTTIIDPIEWLLYANKPEASKTYFNAISRIILEWKNENMRIGHKEWFYNNLLKKFWESIFDVFTKHIDDTEHFPDEIIQLIQCLVQLTHDSVNGNSGSKLPGDVIDTANEDSLKKIALQFSRCCLNKLTDHESQNCVKHIHSFIDIFGEPGFFKDITNSSDLKDSIKFFVDLTSSANKDFYLDLTEIIFKLLNFVAYDEKCEFIKNSLFSVQPLDMQILILEHLLFTSIITSEQRELLLSGPEARTFIRYLTKQSLMKGSITTNAWFERLFVQSENGDFIVGSATIDALLQDLCEHLQKETSAELNELCGNILSQVLPIVFTQKNVLHETKAKMFSNIFQVLVQSITNNFLTDSTFLKLTTCWENVLSNEKIVAEETTISCTNFLKHMVTYKTLNIPIVRKSADLITRFIIGAAKNSCTTNVSSMELNKLIPSCLSSSDISPLLEHLYEYCLVLEAISGLVSPKKQLNYQCLEQHDFNTILQRSVLNLYIIKQLNDSKEFDALKGSFSDNELNLFNNNMCIELLNCMAVLSAGENVLKTKTGNQ